MAEKKKLLATLKAKRSKKAKDPCFVCDKELYLSSMFTARVGIVADGEVDGWICPFCNTQFDLNDNILYIYGQKYVKGDA